MRLIILTAVALTLEAVAYAVDDAERVEVDEPLRRAARSPDPQRARRLGRAGRTRIIWVVLQEPERSEEVTSEQRESSSEEQRSSSEEENSSSEQTQAEAPADDQEAGGEVAEEQEATGDAEDEEEASKSGDQEEKEANEEVVQEMEQVGGQADGNFEAPIALQLIPMV